MAVKKTDKILVITFLAFMFGKKIELIFATYLVKQIVSGRCLILFMSSVFNYVNKSNFTMNKLINIICNDLNKVS
ncbi:hypothetical protein AM629_07270 [Photorhabdus heterorhabditis]|uniref:Uncharacterized protein n=1 Tax=Photorhabdus heterorhabditis TaxID=880156 RepID=A0ABR5KDD8_9GAMM|nr:hypothetical protein AM629_07270 [Photorhabdus heterorhabditis]